MTPIRLLILLFLLSIKLCANPTAQYDLHGKTQQEPNYIPVKRSPQSLEMLCAKVIVSKILKVNSATIETLLRPIPLDLREKHFAFYSKTTPEPLYNFLYLE